MSAPLRGTPPPAEELADWSARAGAALVDAAVVVGFVLALAGVLFGVMLLTGDSARQAGETVRWNALILSLPIALLYAPLLMARDGARNGQTWGKQLAGIRVIRNRVTPMDVWWGLLRDGLGKHVLSAVTLLLNLLWPLWDRERQALHDKLADTWVVRASQPAPAEAEESRVHRAERGG